MKTNFLSLLSMCLLLWSCGGNSDKQEAKGLDSITPIVDSTQAPVDEFTDFKFQYYISNIPSPFETMKELSKAEFPYKADLVNKTENEKKYLTTVKKALNYGVYGVDLAYMANSGKFQDAPKYFETVHRLASSLDAASSFDKVVGKRMDKNWENKDTITHIMDQAFTETDKYLKNGERQLAAVAILAGAWIESQHIIFNLVKNEDKNEKNQFLVTNIWEVRFHVNSLSDLLNGFSDPEIKPLAGKMSSLNEDFKKIKTEQDLTKEKISELAGKISNMRSMIVS